MLTVLDHIDTLIAADFCEESGNQHLSEAMRLLNRPCLEFWSTLSRLRPRSRTKTCRRVSASRSVRYSWTYPSIHTESITKARYNISKISLSRSKYGLRLKSTNKSRCCYVFNY